MSEQFAPVLTIPRPDETDYDAVPGSTSFRNKSLRGDVSKESGTFISRMEAGAVAPWHWHSPTEEFVVLKGKVVCQLQGRESVTLEAGGYTQLPANNIHRFRCTDEGECIVFVVSEGAYDLHWVDGKGQEISEDEANRLSAIEGADW